MQATAAAETTRGRILVVEDEGLIALDIQRSLEEFGFHVVGVAASGEEAIDAVDADRPDLVLLDIHLRGELDGIETAALLRGKHDVAIAYLSAHGDPSTVERAARLAPGGLLLKPFKPQDLFSLVEIQLHRARADRLGRVVDQREKQLAAVLDCIGDAVIATDTSLLVTFMNAAAERLTGWRMEECVGQPVDAFVALQDESSGTPLPALLLEALWDRSPNRVRAATLVTRTGALRHVTQNSAPVFQGDALVGAVLAITDVTDERRDARDLEMAERMASLARHSRAIAHDTNNALTVVGANLLYLSDQCDLVAESTDKVVSDDALGESRRALNDAAKGVSQVQRVVGRLRMFGSDESVSASIEPADVIRWALSVSERLWRKRMRLRLEIDRMPRVEAEEARLGHVMLELITRAASAIRRDESEYHELAVIGGCDADGRALIRIGTTAAPPDLVDESPAAGAPSKLALCASIVRSLGGSLETERLGDGGDEARVRLPAARLVRMPRPTRPLSMLGTGRHGKVLVVDDEELVGQVVSRALGSEHDVVSVLSGREAIDLLSAGVTFDAVVCDVVMPDVSGIDVYYWIHAQQPALMRSFMFLTGGATDAKTVRHLDSLTITSMEKPFRPSELRALVADLVGRGRA